MSTLNYDASDKLAADGQGLAIHSLSLTDFAGVPHVDLKLDDTGVTVVHGRNESGKSTLLNAIKLLLNTSVNTKTKKQDVMALKPVGSSGKPTVAADMTIGDYRLRIEKRFGTGRHSASLNVTQPKVENLVDREAEERFAEILNETVDRTLLDALTVEQGASLEGFSAGQIQSLSTVLDAQADHGAEGTEGGGSSVEDSQDAGSGQREVDATAAELLAAIEQEYERYFTAKGGVKKNGELQLAQDAQESAQQALDEANQTYEGAQALIREIAEDEEQQRSLDQDVPAAERALEELGEKLAAAQAAQQKIEQLDNQVTGVRRELQLAELHQGERSKQLKAIEALRAELAKLEQRRDELAEKAEAVEEKQRAAKEEYAAADEQRQFSRSFRAWAQADERYRTADGAHRELGQKAEQAEEVLGTLRELSTKLAENPATEEALDALSKANGELALANAKRELVATEVEISGPAGTVKDGEEEVELTGEGYRTFVSSPRQFTLGEYRVAITPAQDTTDADAAVQRAREQVEQASAALGVEFGDSEAAGQLAQQRRALKRQQDEAQLSLRAITGDKSAQDLQLELEQAARDLEAAQAKLEQAAAEAAESWEQIGGDAELADSFGLTGANLQDQFARVAEGKATECEIDLAAAEEFFERSDQRLSFAQKAKDEAGQSKVLEDFSLARHTATERAKQLAAAEAELAALREENTDEQLAEAVAVKQSALAEAAKVRDAEKQKYEGAATAEVLQRQLEGEKAHLTSLDERRRTVEMNLVRLSTELAGREGAAEDKAQAAAELERAERALAAVSKRAEAARLLRETMDAARAELRERYSRPLSEAFHVLARYIYGAGVEFEFDENLQASRRIQDGLAIDVAHLSGGAREQVNLLSRLAVASLVAKGGGVPIIIDDSLGYSDPQRSKDMNLVLSKLGEKHQIIVLTCDADRFSRVVGAKQVDMVQLRREGAQ